MHESKDSFECMPREEACYIHYIYDRKEKDDNSKTHMSCKTNCNQTTDDELNSEIDMKERLVKTRVD